MGISTKEAREIFEADVLNVALAQISTYNSISQNSYRPFIITEKIAKYSGLKVEDVEQLAELQTV